MFKVGDKVRVKSSYRVLSMMECVGRESTIRKVHSNGTYSLDIDESTWEEVMLEKVGGCDYCNNMEYMKLREGLLPNYCKICGRELE